MITEELESLKKEFKTIQNMGYIKVSKNDNKLEKKFKNLLNKDKLETYKGIDFKIKRAYSKTFISFLGAPIKCGNNNDIERLRKKYGYPDTVYKCQKILETSVQANCSTLVGIKYLFKLMVDYSKAKVFLVVLDKNMNFIEKKAYWDFALLKEKLENKNQYLALIKTWSKKEDNEDYYKYYDIEFYKLKNFAEFLKLIEDGTIRVSFRIGINRTKFKAGTIYNKGTTFDIDEIDMLKLYDKINI